jgi:peptidoglycan/xylan/chitin deacetylase (PgdA/CDA1 family)
MFPRRLFAVVLASSAVACASLTGCAAPTDATGEDDPSAADTPGDGTSEDAIVSEHSLVGNELPDHTLALTFDDGPGPRTKELADYLAAEGVKATFFINGKNVAGRQAALDAVVGRGHILANHTQNHLQLTKLSAAKVISEVTQTDAFIEQVQPNGPWLLRPPFGAWNGATARAVNGTPMKKYVGSVFWDIGGELTSTTAADWACWGKGVSVERCGDLYMSEMRTRKRGIALMHDVHNKTVDMVKVILPKLKAEGWKFATLEDVPSIKRATGAVSAANAAPDDCSSSTLGRSVPENSCVQSRGDQKWHRCENKEWVDASGAADPKCTGAKFPLQ